MLKDEQRWKTEPTELNLPVKAVWLTNPSFSSTWPLMSAVALGLTRPKLVPRLWQKALSLLSYVSSHSHHLLLHLFTRLAVAGTYAKLHPCKFGEKLNQSGVVCVYVWVCVSYLGLDLFFIVALSHPAECPLRCEEQWLIIITTTRNQLVWVKLICCYLANCTVKRQDSSKHYH